MSRRCLSLVLLFALPLVADAQAPKPRLDAHGFPLPEGAIARLGDLRFAQRDRVVALALSADDKVIATARHPLVRIQKNGMIDFQFQNHIVIWNAKTGLIQREFRVPAAKDDFGHEDLITAIAFAKNSRLLGVGMGSGYVSIWNVHTGKEHQLRERPVGTVSGGVSSLHFLDSDRVLVVGYPAGVLVWDLAKGALVREWDAVTARKDKAPSGYRNARVAFSPSGKRLARLVSPVENRQGGEKTKNRCEIIIQNTLTGVLVRKCTGPPGPMHEIFLLDEGNTALLEQLNYDRIDKADENANSIVDVKSGRILFRFSSRVGLETRIASPTRVLAVSRSQKLLFTSDDVGTSCRDLTSGKVVAVTTDHCGSLVISSDGKRLLMPRGSRLHWCDQRFEPLNPAPPLAEAFIRYRADGRIIAREWGHQSSARRLHVWDPRAGKIIERHEWAPPPTTGRNARDDHDVLHARQVRHHQGAIVVHDLSTNREACRLQGVKVTDANNVLPSLSPDGNRVLVSFPDKDGVLACWYDAATGKELGRLAIPARELFPAHRARTIEWLSQDGSVFGYRTPDSRLTLFHCQTRKKTMPIGVPRLSIKAAGWLIAAWQYRSVAQGRFILAYREPHGGPDQVEFAVFDQKSGAQLRHVLLKNPGPLDTYNHIHLSADGRSLWAPQNGSDLVMFDTATGRPRGRLATSVPFGVFDLAPDGKTLATSCRDSSILIWDINRPLSDRPKLMPPRSAKEAEKLWQVLGDPDPAAMEPALWALVACPKFALPVIEKNQRPMGAERRPGRAAFLIKQLDSADYKIRESAVAELKRMPGVARPALFKAISKDKLSLEQKRRIEALLAKIEYAIEVPTCLREIRAIEVLERIGSPEARKLIEVVATGDAEALLTREARLVLARWPK